MVWVLLGLTGGCVRETPRSWRPDRMPAVEFRYWMPGSQKEERITITTVGQMAARGPMGNRSGQLDDQQMAALGRVFAGWERLAEVYPAQAEGPFCVLAYGGKAVTGGALDGAPVEVQIAVISLRQLAGGLKREK